MCWIRLAARLELAGWDLNRWLEDSICVGSNIRTKSNLPAKTIDETMPGTPESSKLRVSELRTELQLRGLKTTGRKAELMARLDAAIAAELVFHG